MGTFSEWCARRPRPVTTTRSGFTLPGIEVTVVEGRIFGKESIVSLQEEGDLPSHREKASRSEEEERYVKRLDLDMKIPGQVL